MGRGSNPYLDFLIISTHLQEGPIFIGEKILVSILLTPLYRPVNRRENYIVYKFVRCHIFIEIQKEAK